MPCDARMLLTFSLGTVPLAAYGSPLLNDGPQGFRSPNLPPMPGMNPKAQQVTQSFGLSSPVAHVFIARRSPLLYRTVGACRYWQPRRARQRPWRSWM